MGRQMDLFNCRKTYYPDGDNSPTTTLYASFPSVQEIDLPSQAGALAYSFAYNGNAVYPNHSTGYGEISGVTLPSGATTTYQYARDNVENIETTPILLNNVTTKTLSYRAEYDGLTGTSAPLVSEQWSYNPGHDDFIATVTNPDGGVSTEYFSTGLPYTKPYKTVSPDGAVVERIWQENLPSGDSGSGIYDLIRMSRQNIAPLKMPMGSYPRQRLKIIPTTKMGMLPRQLNTIGYHTVA